MEKFKNVKFFDLESKTQLDYQIAYDGTNDEYSVFLRMPGPTKHLLGEKKLKTTNINIPSIDAKEKQFLVNFFMPSANIPNMTKEQENLRAAYFQELDAAEKKEGGCSNCKRNSIRRKYIPQILKTIKK